VAWLRSTPEALAEALEDALPAFDDLPGVVVEGTHVALHLDAVFVLAARPPVRKIKPSARATASRADLPVLNLLPGWKGGGTELLMRELPVFAAERTLPFRGSEPDARENREFFQELLRRLDEWPVPGHGEPAAARLPAPLPEPRASSAATPPVTPGRVPSSRCRCPSAAGFPAP